MMRVRWAYKVALAIAGDLEQHKAWTLFMYLTDGYEL
jgi:hypothetical protein